MNNICQFSMLDPNELSQEEIEDILREAFSEFSDEVVPELSSLNDFTGEMSVSEDLSSAISKYLDKFPRVEQEIAILRFNENCDLDDISVELDLPKEVVEKHYSKIFKKLKGKLCRIFSKQRRYTLH